MLVTAVTSPPASVSEEAPSPSSVVEARPHALTTCFCIRNHMPQSSIWLVPMSVCSQSAPVMVNMHVPLNIYIFRCVCHRVTTRTSPHHDFCAVKNHAHIDLHASSQ